MHLRVRRAIRFPSKPRTEVAMLVRAVLKNSAVAPCTHPFLDTLTVPTAKINPRQTPPTPSAHSTTTDHPVVFVPSDGQLCGHQTGGTPVTECAQKPGWFKCAQNHRSITTRPPKVR